MLSHETLSGQPEGNSGELLVTLCSHDHFLHPDWDVWWECKPARLVCGVDVPACMLYLKVRRKTTRIHVKTSPLTWFGEQVYSGVPEAYSMTVTDWPSIDSNAGYKLYLGEPQQIHATGHEANCKLVKKFERWVSRTHPVQAAGQVGQQSTCPEAPGRGEVLVWVWVLRKCISGTGKQGFLAWDPSADELWRVRWQW